jgi:hypothetical protein
MEPYEPRDEPERTFMGKLLRQLERIVRALMGTGGSWQRPF